MKHKYYDEQSIMNPYIFGNQDDRAPYLSEQDVETVRSVYGSDVGTVSQAKLDDDSDSRNQFHTHSREDSGCNITPIHP
jgi:hypothetical protein